MAIDDRNLSAGTQLTATYKGQTYTLEVLDQDGERRYRLAGNPTLFKSPSSAGKAAMDGKSCNGWAFWRLASDTSEAGSTEAPTRTPSTRAGVPVPKPQRKATRGKHAPKEEEVEEATETPASNQPEPSRSEAREEEAILA